MLLHDRTKQQLKAYLEHPTHAVLLTGPAGSGKLAVARHLAATLLDRTTENLDTYPYLRIVSSIDRKAISIEQTRAALKFLELKVPGQAAWNRGIIIENADLMTTEAQNAFLKTLEEPPAGTFVILTTPSVYDVLPTIRSRTQQLTITLPTSAETVAYFEQQGASDQQIRQAYNMSGGLPGLMAALLENKEHPLLAAATKARELVSTTAFERLCLVDELSKQRELTENSLQMLQQMAHITLQNKALPPKQAARWTSVMTASYQALNELNTQTQPKLALTKLMLAL